MHAVTLLQVHCERFDLQLVAVLNDEHSKVNLLKRLGVALIEIVFSVKRSRSKLRSHHGEITSFVTQAPTRCRFSFEEHIQL